MAQRGKLVGIIRVVNWWNEVAEGTSNDRV